MPEPEKRQVEWKKEFYTGHPPGGRHRKNSFVSESPVTDGRHVYVYVANLGLWAFDLKGKLAWTTPLEPNPIYLDFGTGSSPALAEDLLVILSDNEKQQFIAAFDKHTGKHELDDMVKVSPALVGDRLLIRTEQRLYSIRRKT